MTPNVARLLLVACSATLLAFGVVASALESGKVLNTAPLTDGLVYSFDAGDPIDVTFSRDGRQGCVSAQGPSYPSTTSCFDVGVADRTGSNQLVIPLAPNSSPLLLGVMPVDASRVTVVLRDGSVKAETRGRWFLASLEPGAIEERNSAPVGLEYDP